VGEVLGDLLPPGGRGRGLPDPDHRGRPDAPRAEAGGTSGGFLPGWVVGLALTIVPGSLVALLGIAAGALLDLEADGVAIVGPIDAGLPRIGLTDGGGTDYLTLVGSAVGVLLIGYAEELGAAKTYAVRAGYDIDPNRELLGLGAANLGAGLASGMVVNGSLPMTASNGDAGARSQVSALTVAALTVITLLFLTGTSSPPSRRCSASSSSTPCPASSTGSRSPCSCCSPALAAAHRPARPRLGPRRLARRRPPPRPDARFRGGRRPGRGGAACATRGPAPSSWTRPPRPTRRDRRRPRPPGRDAGRRPPRRPDPRRPAPGRRQRGPRRSPSGPTSTTPSSLPALPGRAPAASSPRGDDGPTASADARDTRPL
jgi:hypothetical protein